MRDGSKLTHTNTHIYLAHTGHWPHCSRADKRDDIAGCTTCSVGEPKAACWLWLKQPTERGMDLEVHVSTSH
ncbi:hypothetical protein ATANTOWER_013089 [Ataeniobius toweri]|uniref:Uncharacterized protein n=1 Tax=Ataeniobius toweri TaxID=208326 RepID=A0ABU7A260_9TELE|nr:hypothetical protein [Ataeniobius toweri]